MNADGAVNVPLQAFVSVSIGVYLWLPFVVADPRGPRVMGGWPLRLAAGRFQRACRIGRAQGHVRSASAKRRAPAISSAAKGIGEAAVSRSRS